MPLSKTTIEAVDGNLPHRGNAYIAGLVGPQHTPFRVIGFP
jgi:hypothetical protein